MKYQRKALGIATLCPVMFQATTRLSQSDAFKKKEGKKKKTHSTSHSLIFMRITALPALKENLLRTFLLQDKSQRPGGLSSWREQTMFPTTLEVDSAPPLQSWNSESKCLAQQKELPIPQGQGHKGAAAGGLQMWLKATGALGEFSCFLSQVCGHSAYH